MNLQEIKAKYEKEQTILETQIATLESEVKNYRNLAGISENASYEDIKKEAERVEAELKMKEDQISSLIAELESKNNG